MGALSPSSLKSSARATPAKAPAASVTTSRIRPSRLNRPPLLPAPRKGQSLTRSEDVTPLSNLPACAARHAAEDAPALRRPLGQAPVSWTERDSSARTDEHPVEPRRVAVIRTYEADAASEVRAEERLNGIRGDDRERDRRIARNPLVEEADDVVIVPPQLRAPPTRQLPDARRLVTLDQR